MRAKFIGPTELHHNPDPWKGERDEVAKLSDVKLIQRLAGWKVGSEAYLIVQAEIEKRKMEKQHSREDKKFYWVEFRSWVSVGLSVVALAVALGVALYK